MADPIHVEDVRHMAPPAADHSFFLSSEEIEIERKANQLEEEQTVAQILAQEKLEIIKMRGQWSVSLLWVIIAIVLFDFFVILAVGFHWMTFADGYLIPIFIGESFLKTIGLAVIVVGFLFHKDSVRKEK